MNYLISVKASKDAKPAGQQINNEHDALNLARRAILACQPMEETSADLKAMEFMNSIEEGKARVIEHPTTGVVMVFQIHKNAE